MGRAPAAGDGLTSRRQLRFRVEYDSLWPGSSHNLCEHRLSWASAAISIEAPCGTPPDRSQHVLQDMNGTPQLCTPRRLHNGARLVSAVMLLLLPAVARAGQGPHDDKSQTSSQASTLPADAPGGGRPLKPTLEARTRNFDPGRFNLSARGGIGLIQGVSPYVLRPWKVAVSPSVLNFDRNPGDIDFFAYGLQAAVGLPGRLELFISTTPVLRTNSVNQDPVGYPVPPLDLFVDTYPTPALRSQPYFLYAQEVPYKSYNVESVWIDPPGHGAFASSSGDVTLGIKMNVLSEDRGAPFALGVRGHLEIPTERPQYNSADWRHLAGVSGKTDAGADLLFAKIVGRAELLLNAAYEHVGDPDRGLRIQYVDSSKLGTPGFLLGAAVETKLDLRDELMFTAGSAIPAFAINGLHFWLLGELSYTRYIAGATRVERLVHPAEMRLGLQANVPKYPRVSIGAAWQLLLNDAGNGTVRRSMFRTTDGRGDINFSEFVDPGLAATYDALFISQGASLSDRSSRVFSTDNAAFDASRNIPAGDTPVVGMGGGNVLAFVTWRIN
jgi:hypothetical protein